MAATLPRSVRAALEGHSASSDLLAAFAAWLKPGASGAAGEAQPCPILLFEDVHWADHLTLDLLKFLGRRMAQWPALLVLTYRSDEVGPDHPLTQVVGELPSARTDAIDLKRLSREALAALSGFPAEGVEALQAATGGNPFFASEVVASCREGAVIDHVPGTVSAAVLARMQRASAAARAVMQAACLVPHGCEVPIIQALVGDAAAQEGLDECVRLGLLNWHERGVAFRHELARQALLQSLPPPRVKAMHARIGAHLHAHEPQALARRVFHAQGAGDTSAVARLAPEAAQQAASMGAHREARAHLATALVHAQGAAPALRATLLEQWADECVQTAQFDADVMAALTSALAIRQSMGDEAAVGRNQLALSNVHRFMMDRAASDAWFERALQTLEALPPGPDLALAYSRRSGRHMLRNEWQEAEHWGQQAMVLAREFRQPAVLAAALNNVGSALVDNGQWRGYDMLEESLAIAMAEGVHAEAARAYLNVTEAAIRNRHHDRANRTAKLGLAYMQDHDMERERPYLQSLAAHLSLVRGNLEEADQLATNVLATVSAAPLLRVTARMVRATVQMLQDLPAGRVALDTLWDEVRAMGEPDYMVPVALSLTECCGLQRDRARGAQVALHVLKTCAALSLWDRGELLVWLHRHGGDVAPWRDQPMAPPAEAELQGDIAQAASGWQALGMPRQHAMTLTRLDALEHPEAWAQATQIFDRMGAVAAASALRDPALRGHDPKRAGPRASTRAHPFGLTSKEMTVVAWLERGASNQTIASALSRSVRTIENHVAAILAKTGAAQRGDVAACLAQAKQGVGF